MNLPRPLRKLINPRETAVLKKDFREIWNSAGKDQGQQDQ